jgi:hypothetical protein
MKYQLRDRKYDLGFTRVFFMLMTLIMMTDLYAVIMPYYYFYKVQISEFSEPHSSYLWH